MYNISGKERATERNNAEYKSTYNMSKGFRFKRIIVGGNVLDFINRKKEIEKL